MTTEATLDRQMNRTINAARVRAGSIVLAETLVPAAGLILLAAHWDFRVALVLALLGLLALAAWMANRARRFHRVWLTRELNARLPGLDDSADLIWRSGALSSLQSLQRRRVYVRLAEGELPDLRPPWPRNTILASFGIGLVLIAMALLFPWLSLATGNLFSTQRAKAPGAIEARLSVTPPAYTRVAASTENTLELHLPEGSEVAWNLHFAREPSHVALVFHDHSTLELSRSGDHWLGSRTISTSALYRVEASGGASDDELYRLDVIPDRPPEIIVRAPDKTLNVLDSAQPVWTLSFEAKDDYGLGPAELSVAHAQGSGEDIKVSKQSLILEGQGNSRERRYEQTLDLNKLGFVQGDDLIVRLSVADNHQPEPHVTRSASFILRWPAEPSAESAGMESLVRQTMPAYFASERQIIIDTEALIAEREKLSASAFDKKADRIGVDQKMLRLRYGQFLGEESEHGGAEHHHEDPHAATVPTGAPPKPEGGHEHEHDAPEPGEPKRGSDDEILHEFGHVHDIKEAATLLDDATKVLLRGALDEMWDAEGQLRLGQLDPALPHENRALEAIKQVQQSTRIYLARVGQDLPQVDPARRLTGNHSGLSDPPAPPFSPPRSVEIPGTAWEALEKDQVPDVTLLQSWVTEHPNQTSDSLALLREAERLRRDPTCEECRSALRAQLWPLLAMPGSALQARALPDAQEASYLGSLPSAAP